MLKWMLRRGLLAATALGVGAIALSAGAAEARTNHAVLVVVTAYPNLPKRAQLVGPNHDAVLVRDYLTSAAPEKFDPANVALLATGIQGATEPTHAAIVGALKAVAEKAVQDDFVYLHFSGHGAQQPETVAGKETDGLDEIFLPTDTGQWQDRSKGVPNALVDDEIGAALEAIRAKGAFVWVIFDACHSGTATRDVTDAPAGEMERKVEFEDLGIPASEMVAAESGAASRGVGEETRESALGVEASPTGATAIKKGGMVAFFAAQTTETTPERPMPRDAADAPSYGVFTYTLFQKLAENPSISYRQLGQAVLQQYSADSQQRPTPLFEGDLDAQVFDSKEKQPVMQWPAEVKGPSVELNAGLLHRLAPGTKLAILPTPQSAITDALGYLEVTSAKNLTSKAKPVAYDGKPALELSAIPPRAYARLAELTINYKLAVARPAANAKLADDVALVNATLDALSSNPEKRFNIELVDADKSADIRLAVLRENEIEGAASDASDKPALWFLPTSGQISADPAAKPPLIAIDPANPQKLADATADNLQKIFRATSLSRLAAASDYSPDQVSVEFKIKREDTDAMEPLDASTAPYVNPGDQVHIVALNQSNKPVDINILYVGSDYSITHIAAERLSAGANLTEGLLAFTDDSFGMERMIAVLTEAPPGSEIEDLSFLEQGKVPPETRAVGDVPAFSALLTDIGLAPSTRSALKLNDKAGSKGAVMIFPVENQPRQ